MTCVETSAFPQLLEQSTVRTTKLCHHQIAHQHTNPSQSATKLPNYVVSSPTATQALNKLSTDLSSYQATNPIDYLPAYLPAYLPIHQPTHVASCPSATWPDQRERRLTTMLRSGGSTVVPKSMPACLPAQCSLARSLAHSLTCRWMLGLPASLASSATASFPLTSLRHTQWTVAPLGGRGRG